ncbi:7-carboxy-7-deazaguanine synthase QueE [Allorhodopirellula solitaria]|uniref:7-carboxy-7-deazaguanine synthase QueE n=1 Tax=Allorhodopirellula solitaria TaxID=2527987 RepID=UPI001FEB9734|nr:7-carboxy-7-deazaguanine synthase QueE [Allorhodopirellula solitaria]
MKTQEKTLHLNASGSPSLRIAETFTSLQGEGLLTGVPSFFIRTSGCNLRCWFCDTPYASWNPEGNRWPLVDLIEAAAGSRWTDSDEHSQSAAAVEHVVLTGGEPLIMSGVADLAIALRAAGMHVTIETAGTVDIDISCDLLSLSPKLRGSTPGRGAGPALSENSRWGELHEQRRLPIATMRGLIERAPAVQVKFVVDSPAEYDEILEVVADLDVAASDVWIMPQGVTVEQLDAAAVWLRPWAEAAGFAYCDRMQIRWYGNRRGT